MAGETTLGALENDIDRMISALTNNATDLDHMSSNITTLTALKAQLISINNQQEAAKTAQQTLSAQLSAKQKEARDELRKARNSVKGFYGDKSQKLEEFGIVVKA